MKRLTNVCIGLLVFAFGAALAPLGARAEISGDMNFDVVGASEGARDLRIGLEQFEQRHVLTIEEKHERRE